MWHKICPLREHSEYLILIIFPQLQWLRERASMLRHRYITCLFYIPKGVYLLHDIQSLKATQVNFHLQCRLPHTSYVRGLGGLSCFRSRKISAELTGNFLLSGQKFAMLEMKSTISAMLRHYKLFLEDPNETLPYVMAIILKSSTGVRLKIEPRAWSAPGP